MSDADFSPLIAQIERDLGVNVARSAPIADPSAVPSALRPLYEFSDGLTLPFANIYPASKIDRTVDPNWLCFGADNYFSYFLCHPTDSPAITTWDHESRTAIEAVYESAIQWLTEEYNSYIDSDIDNNSVVVSAIPNGVSKSTLIGMLKPLAEKSSSDWLALIREGSFSIHNVSRLRAITSVRALQGIGLECHVNCQV
jgi:hypothetical protein